MTMTFSLDNQKLSNRWSELLTQCLEVKGRSTTPERAEETPADLHAYMMEKIVSHRAA
ncbi:hypothetical protein ACXM2N_10695 [Corynebacterium sp. ZY180755]